MAAYSMDLRTRVLRDGDAGMLAEAVAERYHVSRAWVHRLKQRRRETGEIAPRKQTRWRTPILAGQQDQLRALITEQPDRTLVELRAALQTSASLATIWRAIDRLNLTVKKNRTRGGTGSRGRRSRARGVARSGACAPRRAARLSR